MPEQGANRGPLDKWPTTEALIPQVALITKSDFSGT
jgi:hypothetical protein